jgi:uncharacterized membrane protein
VTEILLLATIILGALLHDTRRRLAGLERVVGEGPYALRPAAQPESAVSIREVAVPRTFDPAPVIAPLEPESLPPEPTAEAVAAAFEAGPDVPHVVIHEDAPLPEEPADPVGKPAASGFGFEDLFGRKLPIWAGGITLIVAAVLMVKYSIDSGLLSPIVRVMLGLLFGMGLIAGAELARRSEDKVRDPRVAQSLAGAGIGGLYAAVLAAANLYGLVGPGAAFAGLAAITSFAMVLAMRFGVPCAVLGLVGGLATPAVVQSSAPSVPLLAGYLAIVIGSLTLLSRRQRWVWLGIGALVGGAGWSLALIVLGGLDIAATLSLGLLMLLLGLGLPALSFDRHAVPILHVGAAVVAALQLALLVATGAFAPLTWGLYGLLSLAFVWLAGRTPMLRNVVAVPVLTALGLVALWPSPDMALFAAVIAGIVLIYGGYALRNVWRDRGGLMEVGLLGAVSLGGYALSFGHFYTAAPGQGLRFALLALLFAGLPAIGAAMGWRQPTRRDDARFALLASGSGLLVVLAALVGLPAWAVPIAIAFVAATLLALGIVAKDDRLSLGALVFQTGAILALPITDVAATELGRFFETAAVPHVGQAVLRWAAVALTGVAFAWHHADRRLALLLQPVATVLGYGLVAQIVPAPWLAIAAAAVFVVLAEATWRRPALRLAPTLVTLAAFIGLWALECLGRWMVSGLMSLAGDPVFAMNLPAPGMTAQRLLVPGLACAVVLWRTGTDLPNVVRKGATALVGAPMLVGVHIFYKNLLLIGDPASFVRIGLAERTLWEFAVIGAGVAVWRVLRVRDVALALIGAGAAHNLLYTVLLHDPLWGTQAVGPWPLVNLLLPAFGIAFAAPSLFAWIAPEAAARVKRLTDLLRMGLIVLFAFATLRQLFCGNLLTVTEIGEVENICQSVLGIALALGFLLWGIRSGLRDWRIASLVLILLAVVKVFLFDASGLEGLLRIASFLALGFSLIGIGWLYSRNLKG